MDALERDFYEERRRRWRRSAFWRGFGLAALIALIVAAFAGSDADRGGRATTSRASRSAGIITDDPERDELLAEIAERDERRGR